MESLMNWTSWAQREGKRIAQNAAKVRIFYLQFCSLNHTQQVFLKHIFGRFISLEGLTLEQRGWGLAGSIRNISLNIKVRFF